MFADTIRLRASLSLFVFASLCRVRTRAHIYMKQMKQDEHALNDK